MIYTDDEMTVEQEFQLLDSMLEKSREQFDAEKTCPRYIELDIFDL